MAPVNEHMMKSMQKYYGKKKGKEVYFAMEQKAKDAKKPTLRNKRKATN